MRATLILPTHPHSQFTSRRSALRLPSLGPPAPKVFAFVVSELFLDFMAFGLNSGRMQFQSLLKKEIFSESAESSWSPNADLSTWGAKLTPGLGPYKGTQTGIGGY